MECMSIKSSAELIRVFQSVGRTPVDVPNSTKLEYYITGSHRIDFIVRNKITKEAIIIGSSTD